jgi:WD40 repeat protein
MNAFPSPVGPFATKTAAFGLDGSRVICRSRCILDAATGDTAAPLPPQGQVSCVAASPDGRMAAMGFAMGSTDLIDVATGSRHAKFVGHTSTIRAIGFSPGGTEMATGSLDGTIRLWALPGGALLHVLDGHEGFVDAVLYTPDGRRVVTAANDGTVRIWDTASGQQLVSLPGQRETAGAIAIAPDGAHLVTANPEGAVRIWGLSNAAITAARAAAAALPSLAGPGAAAAVTGRR